jgi:hypothetical protein
MIENNCRDFGELSSLSDLRSRAVQGLPISGAAQGSPAKFAAAPRAERLDTAHSTSLPPSLASAYQAGQAYWRLQRNAVIQFLPLAFPLLPCRMMKKLNHAPNLTQRPPRSPRVRLGGYVVLPRILDKGRAEIAGTAGEFKYNNPGDYHWFRFTGITPEALKAELAIGKGDGEMLAWIQENAPNKRSPWEIQQWSAYFSERGPDSDVETLEMFADRMKKFNPAREDVKTWFDLLDLDDHVTFGGKG